MDEDGYPTEYELRAIQKWNPADLNGLMAYIKERWKYANNGYWEEKEIKNGKKYILHTAGWSGNESIIGAMMENQVFWMMFWEESRRGGHYIFSSIDF